MSKNKRYIKSINKSIRIDEEVSEYIAFLNKHHISWQQLIYSDIKEILKNKAKEYKFKTKVEKLPF